MEIATLFKKTLYKKNSNGSTQTWIISVKGNEITTTYGKVDGKLITTIEVIKEGKNIGKSNELSKEEQALAQAKSDWTGKLKKGYVELLCDAIEGKVNTEVIEGGMFPMLAHKYADQSHKIVYPAFAQPKLDGHRCIAIKDKDKWTLWSRTRKPITGVPHIIQALNEYSQHGGEDYIFDGELYNHDYKNKFEELTHFIRQETPQPGHEIVQYHIYDIAHPGLRNSQRIDILHKVQDLVVDPIKIVYTCLVTDGGVLENAFSEFLQEGYEGAMVRNMHAMYVNKRSYDLQKVKDHEEKDYKIIGVEEGKGSMTGKAIFVCITDKGDEFKAKMVGTLSSLEKYITNPELAIGKIAEIKYQGFTNKNEVPRFPVCMRIKVDL